MKYSPLFFFQNQSIVPSLFTQNKATAVAIPCALMCFHKYTLMHQMCLIHGWKQITLAKNYSGQIFIKIKINFFN